jgi:5-methylcytosine-specific restriction endonuclease McrA
MDETKKCSMCKETKPVTEFFKDKRARGGLYSCCKSCHRKKTKRYYEENRAKVLERSRRYQQEHPEKRKEARYKWEAKNPGNLAERKKRYRKRHARKLKAEWAAYYEENRERILAQKAEYREENREAIYARRDWEKHEEGLRRRRAKKLEAYVAAVVSDEIVKRDQGICGICSKPIMGKLELDHVIPLARGGTHEPDNVQLAHSSCNRKKHARVDFTL